MPDAADELRKIADHSGMTVHIAGQGGQAADSAEAFGGIDGILLVSTLLVVILILLVTYRSPVLWILPIFSAVIGLFTAQAVVYLLAKYADLTVNGQSQGILTVLVIGAGTDYALLLVARYREELRRHEDRHEAMAFALHRASPAIFASGMTVVLGMLCLLVAEMNSTAGLGPVLAVGIIAALAVMTTLLPALLVICGRWVFWPKRPGFGSPEPTATGFWARVGTRVSRRPRSVWVGTAAALAVACLGDPHAGRQRTLERGLLHQGVRLDRRTEGAHRARAVRPVRPAHDRRQQRQGRRRGAGPVRGPGPRRAQPAGDQGRRRVHRGTARQRRLLARPRSRR
jgi:RND superfamily putative drug exporter